MQTELLRTFLAITDTGNFTLAGQRVGRTQSAVSQQVRRLEQEIGRTLLQRSAAGVSLTPDGRRFLSHAREILAAHDRALDAFEREAPGGSVVLGMPEVYGDRVLPLILPDFQARHPNATVALELTDSHTLQRMLRAGRLDMCFLTEREVGAVDGPVVWTDEIVWAGPRDLRPERQTPLPLVTWKDGTAYRKTVTEALRRSGIDYRIAVSTQSVGGIVASVAAGLGIAAVTRTVLTPKLRILGPEAGLPRMPQLRVRLLTPDVPLRPVVARFRDHILSVLGGEAA